jgi:hypothetical protein
MVPCGLIPGMALDRIHRDDPYHPSPDACLRRFMEEGGELPEQ